MARFYSDENVPLGNAHFAARADEVRGMERTLSSQRSQSRGSEEEK